MKTALYRHFDANGRLLYVGISNDALRRLCQHKDRSHWYQQIARIDIAWCHSRRSALEAEACAIKVEAPLWNLRGPAPREGNFAIEHIPTGRRDGNYFASDDAYDGLAFWLTTFPARELRLIEATPGQLGGATAFRAPLRSPGVRA